MSKKQTIFFIALGASLLFYSCKSTSYPCPAYNESGNKNASMKVGPDGTPISSVDRQFDENGLIKKKKVKRIHK